MSDPMTTTPNPTPTSQILDAAADHIDAFGHHKGAPTADPDNPYTSAACVIGAITWTTCQIGGDFARAYDAIRTHLDGLIAVWNDAPGRTATEVVAALRACALLEAAREEAATQAPADRHEVAL